MASLAVPGSALARDRDHGGTPKEGASAAPSRLTMPILPAEPDLHPADLWDDPSTIPAKKTAARWWCLHAKPRQEKAVARDLRRGDLTYYLPQAAQETRTPKGRKVRSVVPLFPGYVFLHGDWDDRASALKGNRLVAVLKVDDQEALESDLRQIQRMLGSGLPIEAEPEIPAGSLVRIKEGPLAGLEGRVIKRLNGSHFVAAVRFLGRGARVQLHDWEVEALADPQATPTEARSD